MEENHLKKIINNKAYDTKTANFIANYSYSNSRDFRYVDEDLYRTNKGNWFIAGQGGPLSEYRIQVEQNSWSGSERITPLEPQEALEWLQEHGKTKAVEEYFSDCIEEA